MGARAEQVLKHSYSPVAPNTPRMELYVFVKFEKIEFSI